MRSQHHFAGQIVRVNSLDPEINGQDFTVEDYWQNIAGKSWMFCDGNPACLKYAIRSAFCNLPTDNEVVYGKIGPFGHLVHVSELQEIVG